MDEELNRLAIPGLAFSANLHKGRLKEFVEELLIAL
jgi:hypothetical protein